MNADHIAFFHRNLTLIQKIMKAINKLRAVFHFNPDILFSGLTATLVPVTMNAEEKQYKKLSNLLQKMKKEGIVDVRGSAVHAEWFLV